jgi:hypothetical protein
MRKLYPTGATMDLENLPAYWEEIAKEFLALEAMQWPNRNGVLSARAFDEAQPAGHRT